MKNEAAVLNRMLTSVGSFVDACICVDTGSTDNSKSIVNEFFKDKNKPCKIYDCEWINYSHARNFALNKAKEYSDLSNEKSYMFWIDCDEQLVIDKNIDIESIKKVIHENDCCLMKIRYGNAVYNRLNFIDLNKDYEWKSPVHEYIEFEEKVNQYLLPENIYILVSPDGHSWTSDTKEKYLQHAKLLEQSARELFYLAQSYKDAGLNEKALRFYKERSEREDGFYEEKFYSKFMCGLLSEKLNFPIEKSLLEYIEAYEIEPLRAESLLNAILILQKNKLFQISYILSKYALDTFHLKSPYPARQLFLDASVYEKKILIVHYLNCRNLKKTDDIKSLEDMLTLQQFISILTTNWYDVIPLIHFLLDKISPKTTVDLGFDFGLTSYILSLAKNSKVYAMDYLNNEKHDETLHNLELFKEKYKVENINIVNDLEKLAAKNWNKGIDILNINYTNDIRQIYERWSKFVSDDGLTIINNALTNKYAKDLFDQISLPKILIETKEGIGLVSKNNNHIDIIKKYLTNA